MSFWKKQHQDWKNSVTQCPRNELAEVFDVTPNYIIKARRRYLRGLLDDVYEIYGKFSTFPLENWFVEWQRQILRKEIKKLETRLEFTTKKNFERATFNLRQIKQYPIRDILAQRGIEVIGEFFKLRDEKTPSCKIYDEDNRWHDFGSNQGGDSIDLIQELDGCNFQQACKSVT